VLPVRLILPKANVETPELTYVNTFVELNSDDDVEIEALVNNRQGTLIARYAGPFTVPENGGSWTIDAPEGEIVVIVQEGCGCGGTSVVPKQQQEAPIP
jgi:hypothetical protein